MLGKKSPKLRTHNIIYVPVGAKEQNWHTDDDSNIEKEGFYKYFTILIHLNPISVDCGGTEISLDYETSQTVRKRNHFFRELTELVCLTGTSPSWGCLRF